MQDEDDFSEIGVVDVGLYDAVAISDVLRCVGEVALDEALEYVKENAVSVGE